MAGGLKPVRVDLGERSYDIIIGDGVLGQAGARVAELAPGARCAIVADENAARHHLVTLREGLEKAKIEYHVIDVAAGEGSKSFAGLETVVDQLLKCRLERSDLVLAFGGGVIGDLAGFAAAIVRRGMRFVQLPTSLLAQVDSSVGGKTGINSGHGKNLIGAFHQPALVIADTGMLKTLPQREFAAGYAEIVKYGLIDDPQFFEWLTQHHQAIFAAEVELSEAIAHSCRAKARVVAADEYEHGARALLNLGHTFGHALEAACKYDPKRLVHGEGVAIGMVLAHEFSNRLNLCDADSVERVRRHIQEVGLPVSIDQIPGKLPPVSQLMKHIAQDKKVSAGRLTFILTHGIGKAHIARDVQPAEVQSFLMEKLDR